MFRLCGLTENESYYFINVVGILMFFICNFSRIKEKKLSYGLQRLAEKGLEITMLKANLLIVFEVFLLSVCQGAFLRVFNFQFGDMLGTGANYFGLLLYSSLLLIIVSIIIKSNPLTQLDFVTPAYPLALFVSKLACFCYGCCTGFPWAYGYLNFNSKMMEFPVQLIEAMVAYFLFLFIRWYQKRGKEGTSFPVYLLMYSATRFFTEFLRSEENVFAFLKKYQIICLIGIIVGIVFLWLVDHYCIQIKRYYDGKFPSCIGYRNKSESKSGNKSKRIPKYFVSYILILLLLMTVFGKFLISHSALFAGCIAIALLVFLLLQKEIYADIELWKLAAFAAWFMIAVSIITYAIPLRDNGHFNHSSVYSIILAFPVLVLPLRWLRIPYRTLLSLSVLCECLLLIVRKTSCMAGECCIGKYIPSLSFQFPSQMAELSAIVVLFVVFIMIKRKRSTTASIYAWFMLAYGMTQLPLFGFRYERHPSFWNVSNGYAWPVILIGIAIIWLLLEAAYRKYCDKKQRCA